MIVNLVETGILYYLSYVAFPVTFIQVKVDLDSVEYKDTKVWGSFSVFVFLDTV